MRVIFASRQWSGLGVLGKRGLFAQRGRDSAGALLVSAAVDSNALHDAHELVALQTTQMDASSARARCRSFRSFNGCPSVGCQQNARL
mmetsp:Transcript_36446/g.95917  ORF Transcript_36446/g.95917 Transcript_36446/m.95917 type:complete len:88 (+) Transcript_36446:1150-1413(+)